MKKLLLVALSFATVATSLLAQSRIKIDPKITNLCVKVPNTPASIYGAPEPTVVPLAHPTALSTPIYKRGGADKEVQVGSTKYDLQTNACLSQRLVNVGGGKMVAAWTQSQEDTPYADRGTGYNSGNGKVWSASTNARIESKRCGFTNIHVTTAGDEVALTHIPSTTNGGYDINVARKLKGTTKWIESVIPTTAPKGMLWAHTACDGNTIHVIALTTPTGASFGGVTVDGMNGTVLYFRSKDGGATWDIKDKRLPNIAKIYKSVGGDGYTIDADNGKVAIGIFKSSADCTAWISKDNGDTFKEQTINKFPIADGALPLPTPFDTLLITKYDDAPNGRAIPTCDNGGTIIIDKKGVTHAFYGQMYFLVNTPTDSTYNYYPGTKGIMHWVEGQTSKVNQEIGDAVDTNGNGVYDITLGANALYYGNRGLLSFTSAAIGDNNEIIVAYSGLSEFPTQNDNRFYHHEIMIKSLDGGKTFGAPKDLITKETSLEEDLFVNYEAIFGSLARRADTKAHILYQVDFSPGCYVSNNGSTVYQTEISDNFITYQGVPIVSIPTGTNETVVSAASLGIVVSPNPVVDILNIAYTGAGETTQVEVFDMVGKSVMSNTAAATQGENVMQLQVSQLPIGMYVAKMKSGNAATSFKFVKK